MIYLDNAASTPTDESIISKMMPYFHQKYANPHSTTHIEGLNASKDIEHYRQIIGEYFDVEADCVVFTSGATEANNLAIIGAMKAAIKSNSTRKKVLCSSIEHKCVLESIMSSKEYGFSYEFIPVKENGKIDLDNFKRIIDEQTLLVSAMATNNETGIDLQIEEIGELCKEKDILFHTDAAQALHHKKISMAELAIDFCSISAHKIYGPKGIGALICNHESIKKLQPLMLGGYQEAGLRSGTMPTHLVVGLGEAIKLLDMNKDTYLKNMINLKDKFIYLLKASNLNFSINSLEAEHPGLLNLYFDGIDSEQLCSHLLSSVAVSTAAACNSSTYEYSYVLEKMGLEEQKFRNSIRLCIGRQNTLEEINSSINIIREKINLIKTN